MGFYFNKTYYILHDEYYGHDYAVSAGDAQWHIKNNPVRKIGKIILQIPKICWGTPEELEIERRRIALRRWEEQQAEVRE